MATAVVSGRVEESIKRKADAVIRDAGSSVGDVIKGVWQNIAESGELPVMTKAESERARKQRALRELRGLADSLPPCPALAALTDDDLKELMRARHV